MTTITISNESQLPEAAKRLLSVTKGKKLFALYGAMGAGKTTFIKALCKELGSTDCVTSPTFTIVNEYVDKEGLPIYHFDFYRLKTKNEALDFGFEEYLYSNNYAFMEWPEIIEELLPDNVVKVNLKVNIDNNSRTIQIL